MAPDVPRRRPLAKTKLPDPLSRRYLLESELDPAKARALADAYLEAGREIEAIEFFARAGAEEPLRALQGAAIGRGDVFLMKMASAALDEEPTSETWQTLQRAATAAGRERDAEMASRLATVDA
jgi:hypothetical protein